MITTADGKIYTGKSPRKTVDAMRNAGLFTAGKTTDEYMEGVAARVLRFDGHIVRTNNAPTFLRDLAQFGLITITQGN